RVSSTGSGGRIPRASARSAARGWASRSPRRTRRSTAGSSTPGHDPAREPASGSRSRATRVSRSASRRSSFPKTSTFPRAVRRMRERGSRRRLAAALAVFGMVIPLAACSGIPSSGDVVTGSEVSQQDPGGAEYIVEGPAEGDNMEQILRGFISAFRGSGNYDIARQFLSSGFVNEWEPRESVLVHSGSLNYVAASEDTMDVVVGSATASVDAAGSYRRFAAAPSTLHYEFVREAGEWRISAAPNGILLSESQFDI